MYILENDFVTKIEETTFKELGYKESNVEEIIRKNVDFLCEEDDNLLIIGQQVLNEQYGRSDLTAIDDEGNLVLIEIKRDVNDIIQRREAFEFQAIRYAASLAKIESIYDLIRDIYEPYVEKHKNEYKDSDKLTAAEIANRELDSFCKVNNILSNFNKKQKIILIASDFDPQTLSAVAWLNTNNVDISCVQIYLNKLNDKVIFDIKKILPLPKYNDMMIDILHKDPTIRNCSDKQITRTQLPKIDKLLKWGVVKPGDVVSVKGFGNKAVLQEDGDVVSDEFGKQSIQQWLKGITGWAAVETYRFTIDEKSKKTLSELRSEYMESHQDELL